MVSKLPKLRIESLPVSVTMTSCRGVPVRTPFSGVPTIVAAPAALVHARLRHGIPEKHRGTDEHQDEPAHTRLLVSDETYTAEGSDQAAHRNRTSLARLSSRRLTSSASAAAAAFGGRPAKPAKRASTTLASLKPTSGISAQ
jgi:hypothetical protein